MPPAIIRATDFITSPWGKCPGLGSSLLKRRLVERERSQQKVECLFMLLPRNSFSSGCLSSAEGHVIPRNLDSKGFIMRRFLNSQGTGFSTHQECFRLRGEVSSTELIHRC